MNLLHLSMSLVVDLGLGSSTVRFYQGTANTLTTDAERIIHGKAVARGVKTNEERRAALACYYFTSTYSFCFHRLDYLKFSPHLEQCCNDLVAAGEYPSDQSIVAVVRLHQLTEKYLMYADTKFGPNLPLSMYVKLFKQELQRFLSTLPQTVTTDELFDLHLHSTQVCVYESIIPLPNDNAIEKVAALHAGLLAVEKYFSSFLSQHSTSMPAITYPHYMRQLHALSVLAKLSFLHLEGWDLQYVRSTVDFCDLIDRLNDKLWSMQEVEAANGGPTFSRRYRTHRARLAQCKTWFKELVAQEARAQDTDGVQIDSYDPMFSGMLETTDDYLNFDFSEGWPGDAQV